jgi:WD40 repeat protein
VLETHRYPVSAISFSPDGRRLVTASLAEHKVTIWKVGSSFSGFINVGGPPRQGSASGEPFKSLDFFVADPGKTPVKSSSSAFVAAHVDLRFSLMKGKRSIQLQVNKGSAFPGLENDRRACI